jgi:hypothetical protein
VVFEFSSGEYGLRFAFLMIRGKNVVHLKVLSSKAGSWTKSSKKTRSIDGDDFGSANFSAAISTKNRLSTLQFEKSDRGDSGDFEKSNSGGSDNGSGDNGDSGERSGSTSGDSTVVTQQCRLDSGDSTAVTLQ